MTELKKEDTWMSRIMFIKHKVHQIQVELPKLNTDVDEFFSSPSNMLSRPGTYTKVTERYMENFNKKKKDILEQLKYWNNVNNMLNTVILHDKKISQNERDNISNCIKDLITIDQDITHTILKLRQAITELHKLQHLDQIYINCYDNIEQWHSNSQLSKVIHTKENILKEIELLAYSRNETLEISTESQHQTVHLKTKKINDYIDTSLQELFQELSQTFKFS